MNIKKFSKLNWWGKFRISCVLALDLEGKSQLVRFGSKFMSVCQSTEIMWIKGLERNFSKVRLCCSSMFPNKAWNFFFCTFSCLFVFCVSLQQCEWLFPFYLDFMNKMRKRMEWHLKKKHQRSFFRCVSSTYACCC